jgi:hypothetical protein
MIRRCSRSRVEGDKRTRRGRNPTRALPVAEESGWGRPRLQVGGERLSRLRFSGKVSDQRAANHGTHFSRPHRQAAVGRYMNCPFRARLMPRSKLLRCRLATRCVFWTCNALGAGGLLTLPDVPPSVYYPSGRRWQQRRPKPGGQRSLDPRIGRECASSPGDCQHHGGREPVVRDMVNPGEVLIKVVRSDKPKMLTGLDQKGTWSGIGG